MLKKLLLSPSKFFGSIAEHKVDIRLPMLIIVLNSTIGGISGFFLLSKMDVQLPNDVGLSYNVDSLLLIGFIFGAFLSIVASLIIWLVQSFVFHGLASFQGGRGNYRKLLELVGYSQFPLIFSSVITLVMVVSFIPDLSMKMVQDKGAMEQAFLGIPALTASRIFGRLMIFWSLFLSAIAVREVYSISNKKAASAILIPIILYVGITELVKRWFAIG